MIRTRISMLSAEVQYLIAWHKCQSAYLRGELGQAAFAFIDGGGYLEVRDDGGAIRPSIGLGRCLMEDGCVCGRMFTGIVSVMVPIVAGLSFCIISSVGDGPQAILLLSSTRCHSWHALILVASEVWAKERIDAHTTHVLWRSPQAVTNIGRYE